MGSFHGLAWSAGPRAQLCPSPPHVPVAKELGEDSREPRTRPGNQWQCGRGLISLGPGFLTCGPGLVWLWWGVVSECQGPGSGVSLPVWPPTWSGSLTSPGGPALMQGPGVWLRHLLYTHRALVTAGHIPEPLLPLLVSSFFSGYPLFSACPILDGGRRGRRLDPWLG